MSELPRVHERAQRLIDLRHAVLRAQACHAGSDPNQALLSQVEALTDALCSDAAIRLNAAMAADQ